MRPLCTGTESFCLSNINTTKSRFVSAVNGNRHIMILPSYDFHPSNSSLFNTYKNNSLSTLQFMNITSSIHI